MEKVIFISQNKNVGSDLMRVKQIVNILNNDNVIIKVAEYEELKNYENTTFVWVKEINIDIIKSLHPSNIHIYDIIDNYIYKPELVTDILNSNIINTVIVNNKFTVNHIYKNTKFNGSVKVIYHHWDPIYNTAILNNQDKLTFGYMGSLPSLYHTDNFLYYNDLIQMYQVELLNTEDGKYYNNILTNTILGQDQCSLENININFNCHVSIRKINSNVAKFKTSAKIATASFFNHNIITIYEESVKDLLTDEYPFIIRNDDIESVKDMFTLAINDYNSDKVLWNKGLSIMEKVRERLDITNIKDEYCQLLKLS